MAITYNNLYLDIRQQLKKAGIEEATLEARELVCFGTGKSREQLQRDGGLYASPVLEGRVRDLVARHLAGEPVAYLIGEWEFYGLPLDISRDVLIPRSDTEVLAGQAIEYLKTLGECRVLDLCAGSGCIGLAAASQVPRARVVLGEWSDGALKICRQNIRRNGLSTVPFPKSGRRPWSPVAGCTLRSASARRMRCCASCGPRASAISRSSRTFTISPGWFTAPSAQRFESLQIEILGGDTYGKRQSAPAHRGTRQ